MCASPLLAPTPCERVIIPGCFTRVNHLSPHAHERRKLTEAGLEEAEMCLLVNLVPESAEEAYALIPSLKVRAAAGRRARSLGPPL